MRLSKLLWPICIIIFLLCQWCAMQVGINLEHEYHKFDIPPEVYMDLCPGVQEPEGPKDTPSTERL